MQEMTEIALQRQLCDWFESPLGRSLEALEAHRLRGLLPSLYGRIAVQLGRIGRLDLLDASPTAAHLVVDSRADGVAVRASASALPLDGRSVDVVLMPHTLDVAPDPRQVLRETQRVLAPEGHVVILGFNPMSLWGLWRLAARRRQMPWRGHFVQLFRLKDWLALLDFEITQGSMLYYRPPLKRESWMERLSFMEDVGDRWWPMGAAVYCVVAKKREFGVTPIVPAWRLKRLKVRAGQPALRLLRWQK